MRRALAWGHPLPRSVTWSGCEVNGNTAQGNANPFVIRENPNGDTFVEAPILIVNAIKYS